MLAARGLGFCPCELCSRSATLGASRSCCAHAHVRRAAGALGAGGAAGHILAKRMAITDLPQMVAAFHSLVGLAAVRIISSEPFIRIPFNYLPHASSPVMANSPQPSVEPPIPKAEPLKPVALVP